MAGAIGGEFGLAERAFRRGFAKLQEGNADPRQHRGRRRKQDRRLAVVAALNLAVGREADRGAARPGNCRHRFGRLAQQAEAILDRAAIFVVAKIGAVAQELVDQIAVGGMDLHAVEARQQGIARCGGIVLHHARNFIDPERAGVGIRQATLIGVRLVRCRGRGRRDRLVAAEKAGMDEPAHMPQLAEDPSARFVHRLRDRFPGLDLLAAPDARRVRPSQPLPADAGCFGEDESRAGALRVIGPHQLGRHMFACGAAPGQRRHQRPIGRGDSAKLDRSRKD